MLTLLHLSKCKCQFTHDESEITTNKRSVKLGAGCRFRIPGADSDFQDPISFCSYRSPTAPDKPFYKMALMSVIKKGPANVLTPGWSEVAV